MRKVFLDDLPRLNYAGYICWADTIGMRLKFIYDELEGELEIVDYRTNGKHPELHLNYNGNKRWVKCGDIRIGKIGRLLNIRKKIIPR